MPVIETQYPHVVLDASGTPTVAGTTMKVVELVTEAQAHRWDAAELQDQHPYLSLAEIHSALAYYWDHKVELDADMLRRDAMADEMAALTAESPVLVRLRRELRSRSTSR
jgi:uncharacterized protein (DUF433 family)